MDQQGLWIAGLRSDIDHPTDWRRVLFSRLSGLHLLVPQGVNTAAAEAGLFGGSESVYFYVDISNPRYGFVISIHGEPTDLARVAPFDTGGLWHDKITTLTSMTATAKRDAVADWTFDLPRYRSEMIGWVDRAFDSRSDYSRGETPTTAAVPFIDPHVNTLRSWSWEGRIPRADYVRPPCRPISVLMSDEDAASYFDWVELSAPLTELERMDHIREVTTMLLSSTEPAVDTTTLLVEGDV